MFFLVICGVSRFPIPTGAPRKPVEVNFIEGRPRSGAGAPAPGGGAAPQVGSRRPQGAARLFPGVLGVSARQAPRSKGRWEALFPGDRGAGSPDSARVGVIKIKSRRSRPSGRPRASASSSPSETFAHLAGGRAEPPAPGVCLHSGWRHPSAGRMGRRPLPDNSPGSYPDSSPRRLLPPRGTRGPRHVALGGAGGRGPTGDPRCPWLLALCLCPGLPGGPSPGAGCPVVLGGQTSGVREPGKPSCSPATCGWTALSPAGARTLTHTARSGLPWGPRPETRGNQSPPPAPGSGHPPPPPTSGAERRGQGRAARAQ